MMLGHGSHRSTCFATSYTITKLQDYAISRLHTNTSTKIMTDGKTAGGHCGGPIPRVIQRLRLALPKGLEGF